MSDGESQSVSVPRFIVAYDQVCSIDFDVIPHVYI